MANSITSSNVAPISILNLNDAQYVTSLNWPAPNTTVTSNVFFLPNISYQTVGNLIVELVTSAISNTTGSYVYSASLQHSMDGVNFLNVETLNPSLLSTTDSGGSAPAASVEVFLNPPTMKKYIRVAVGSPSNQVNLTGSASPSGSVTFSLNF